MWVKQQFADTLSDSWDSKQVAYSVYTVPRAALAPIPPRDASFSGCAEQTGYEIPNFHVLVSGTFVPFLRAPR